MMSDYFHVNPRNVHAYVIGEHGDSEFVPWSQALISVKPLDDFKTTHPALEEDMKQIAVDVRHAIVYVRKKL